MLSIVYIVITVLLIIYGLCKHWRWLVGISYLCFLLVVCALLPLPTQDKQVNIAPTQVVFRFDEHRYLQLTGSGCEGKLYYIDKQKQVYHELSVHSARVLTEPFSHTVGDYIFVPFSDYSGVSYSQDGGRTFKTIDIFSSIHNSRPIRKQVRGMTVVNNQFFMDSSKGFYRSPQPFGTNIGVEILSTENEKYMDGSLRYMGQRWDPQPEIMPSMLSDYTGWYRWQCEFDMKQHEIIYNRYQPIIDLQTTLRQGLGLSQQEEKS